MLPVVQPECLYFSDSNHLYGWIIAALRGLLDHQGAAGPPGFGIPGIQPEQSRGEAGPARSGSEPGIRPETNAASRLRLADVSLGLGPLSVADRLRLSGDLILRRYWKREDRSVLQQGQELIPFPIPHFVDTYPHLRFTQNEDRNRLLGSLEIGFSPTSRTEAALRYSRRDIFDQESYLYPRLINRS